MKVGSKKRLSLYLELFLLFLAAGFISLLFFAVSKFIIELHIERYHENPGMVQKYDKKYISKLQRYITKYNVASDDYKKLDKWVNGNRIIYIQIKKNKKWVYFSDWETDGGETEDYGFITYPADHLYDVNFSDGMAQVFIMGMYSYNTYIIALVVNIIVSFLLFILLAMCGIRRKILYINQLGRDIEILEGGNLDYMVHEKGNDEITDLARGLNAMRISFKNQNEEAAELAKLNKDMVTEISHDLRTPLTSVLLCAEILKSRKYNDEEHRQEYLSKIIKKIQLMKDLSDRLLEYSVNTTSERDIPAEFIPIQSGLYDELSDMCYYLGAQGINVKTDLKWEKGKIFIYGEYIVRILDNISSNILKYAERQMPVLVWNKYYDNKMCLVFENTCLNENNGTESYSIGIRNVKMMINEIGGSCEVTMDGKLFRICLYFRFKSA